MKIQNIEECEIQYFQDIPLELQSDFDYDTEQEGSYFEYLGNWYDLGNFMRNNQVITDDDGVVFECHGVAGMSYFNAIAVRINDSGDGLWACRMYW